ncbi:nucleoporin SONB [Cordyceps fumosorosea ARSEF 2679]|uniref:Nucleoporin SONB n=1 Tax=Cordyceps fumosorosea (strain ARSEF 2679) TaxID=1081104 RepID=A0A168BTT5_CORFA|nr:nucleoporin SONB [Cordyceps fumosorosea ARSEF 2679]OAA70541.1 nucleoporin SONB [Cordyceps fumosorosea ARSEF 2679]
MSFGSGGFGGFGQNNNQQQASAFGTFGQNNNTNTGFGAAANTGGGFGSNTGGGVFGTNTNTGGGFGSGGGFGTNNNTGGAFGSKPAFGAPATTTGNSMFGGTTAQNSTTSAFGGFGATNTANTTSGFGANNNTSGGLFGGSKPTGFGTTTTGNSLFGGGANNTTTTGGFGAASGFGASNAVASGDPPGTAVAPFQAFTEKDGSTATAASNAFQNICFQDPYKKWSPEELRLVDYLQGRKHGNASGTGAFGVSSGFGGAFGATNNNNQTGGAFGSNTANTTTGSGLFGNTNNTNTGGAFGSGGTNAFGAAAANANTGGGLFGNAAKPATGTGMFGNTAAQTQTGSSLFGGANPNTTSGFGTNNNASNTFGAPANNTGGGIFGNTNQNKPAGTGFSFGQNATSNNAGSAFGGGNTASPFGAANTANTGGGLFGSSNTNTQQASGGLFGNTNNTQQQQQQQGNTASPFGGFGQQNQTQQSGGSLFANQNKPATGGLFGSGAATTTNNSGGGLFGNAANTTQQAGSAFGQNTSGGLFGAAKPASGGGLFGASTNAQTNTGAGGLFGNAGNNAQQNTSGSLFGAANSNQQKPSGLFGSSTQATSGSVFGTQNNQAQGSSLFGAANNQQNQQGSAFGGSLLGNSQQNVNAPQGLTANLNDVSAYGTPALFSNLGGNESPNPGPLATPLNGNSKPRRSSILPMYKLAPASASRFATPQKRGFGFSYSSYGTPGGSPASLSSTPSGLGRSLLGSSSSGSLSKSMSTNNLRRTFNSEDSILAPGAFSSSSNTRWYGSTGSKKLVINREIRSDLFTTPQKDKSVAEGNGTGRKLLKRVSFDTSNVDSEETTTPVRTLPAPSNDSPGTEVDDTPRQPKPITNGAKSPEMEQVSSGKELAVVQEDSNATANVASENTLSNGFDNLPGQYWMKPSKEELQAMNRIQRQKVDAFTVSRDNVGEIRFKVPVDLSSIDLDEICGGIIQLEPRSATVYPIAAKKPPMGKGLNVPARISLEQSWPRGGREKRVTSDPRRFNKHIERLQRIPDTTFESYDKDSGVWAFSVEHFTTYGLDDSDDDESDAEIETSREMAVDATPQAKTRDETTEVLSERSRQLFRRKAVPGAFDEHEDVYEDDMPLEQSFLGVSSADSAPNEVRLSLEMEDVADMDEEYDESDDEDMARALVGPHHAAELLEASPEDEQDAKRGIPGGILRARMRAIKDSAGPVRLEVPDGDDWTEMLRKTVSPMKRDRQELRELNESPSKNASGEQDDNLIGSVWGRRSMGRPDKNENLVANAALDKSRGFATSIDLMNSLFEKPKPIRESVRVSRPGIGFPQWPYNRHDKSFDADEKELASQRTPRVTWGPDETIVVTQPHEKLQLRRLLRDDVDILSVQKTSIQSEKQSICLAKFSNQSSTKFLHSQDRLTDVHMLGGAPFAVLRPTGLKDIFNHQDMTDPAVLQEQQVWELANILFGHESTPNMPVHMARRKKLAAFWTELVEQASSAAIAKAVSSEEKAVTCLAGHRITEACKYLLEGRNFCVSTLVSLIDTSDSAKKEMKEQLKSWQDSKMLSEFPEAIRTIYEILSGNVSVCEGLKDVPVEDRMDSFVISKKFSLDWRQAFGMRLWYALNKDEDARSAVKKFKDDIYQDKEDLPEPWYVEQGVTTIWFDADSGRRQNLLWGLLQLYAEPDTDLEAILRPENSQLSPLDVRLTWQLGQALLATGNIAYGEHDIIKADAATVAYAAQLTSASEWLEATFVLLHLRDAGARKQALQEHICRHADRIGAENGPNFTTLTEKLLIPASWIWEALALFMRSVRKDASGEVQCLLRAGSYEEAHRVLVNQVAPQAIVERNYAGLSELISQFKGRQDSISQWSLGGEIYGYFLNLMQHRSKNESVPSTLLERLLVGLNSMRESGPDREILRYAAVSDMADETAREILKMAQKKQDMDLRSRILRLPLTQDRLLAYSVDLGLDRYREVMSH